MNNLLSYCGLVDARISASDKDLPVQNLLNCLRSGLTMASCVRLNVKKMAKHTIGVGKSPDPGIIVPLVSNSTFFV